MANPWKNTCTDRAELDVRKFKFQFYFTLDRGWLGSMRIHFGERVKENLIRTPGACPTFSGSNEDFLFTPLSDRIFCQRRISAKKKVEEESQADIPGALDTVA